MHFFLFCASFHLFYSDTFNIIPSQPLNWEQKFKYFLAGSYGVPVTAEGRNVPEAEHDRESGGYLEKIANSSLISKVYSVL